MWGPVATWEGTDRAGGEGVWPREQTAQAARDPAMGRGWVLRQDKQGGDRDSDRSPDRALHQPPAAESCSVLFYGDGSQRGHRLSYFCSACDLRLTSCVGLLVRSQ